MLLSRRSLVPLAAVLALLVAGCGSSGAPGRAGSILARGPLELTTATPIGGGAAWPQFLHGPSHFGAAAAIGPQRDGVRWRRSLGGSIVAGPVITAAGQAYVASTTGILHAVDISTGRDRWTFNGQGSHGMMDLSTSPLVLPDGRVLWPGPHDSVFGISSRGRLLWTLRIGAGPVTPVLDPVTGQLIVADQGGAISAYRLSRGSSPPSRVWSRRLASMSYGSPAVAKDGTIYETAGDALYALTPSGLTRWKLSTPKLVEVSPAVAQDGVVVFGSDDLREYGVSPDGRLRWRVPIGNFTYSSPLTLADHRVIFGNHSGQMTVLDSGTGRLITRYQARGQLWTAAAVDRRGDAYFGSRLGHVFGFTRAGGRLIDFNAGSTFDSYPALASDGTLLIGADNGILYAINRPTGR